MILLLAAGAGTVFYFRPGTTGPSTTAQSTGNASQVANEIASKLQVSDPVIASEVSHALLEVSQDRQQTILNSLSKLSPDQLTAGNNLLTNGLVGLDADQRVAAFGGLLGVETQAQQVVLTSIVSKENTLYASLMTRAVFDFPEDWTKLDTNLQICEEALYGILQGTQDPAPACQSPLDQSVRATIQPALTKALEYEQGLGTTALARVPGAQALFANAIAQQLNRTSSGDLVFLYFLLAPPPPQDLVNLYAQVLNLCTNTPANCTIGDQQFLVMGFLTPSEPIPPQVQQALANCLIGVCSSDDNNAITQFTNQLTQDYKARQKLLDQAQQLTRDTALDWWKALGPSQASSTSSMSSTSQTSSTTSLP